MPEEPPGWVDFPHIVSLMGILLLGAALRLYQLGFQCMWTEELYTLNLAGLSPKELTSQVMATDFNPPLFYLFSGFSQNIFQTAEAIRYPSVVCGILLILVMYCVGKEYSDSTSGLYTAGFTAVLYPLIYYSQFGRAYEMCIFFFALSFWCFLRLYSEGHPIYSILFGITSSLAIYTHLFAVIPVGLLLAYLLFSRRWMDGLISSMTALFLCLPILGMLFSVLVARRPGAGYTYGMSLLELIFNTPFEFFDFAWPLFTALGVVAWVKNKRLDRLLIAVTGITILAGLACSLLTAFFPRYYLLTLVLLLPVIATIFSDALTNSSSLRKTGFLVFIVGALLFLQSSDLVYHYFTQQYVC